MSTPTITETGTGQRTVGEEVIDTYTEDAKLLGLDSAASIAGLLSAYIDTYFVGRDDNTMTAGRDTLMAQKIKEAFEFIQSLPCMCDLHGKCRRCQVTGEDELLDVPHDATADLRTARVIDTVLTDHGLDAALSRRIASSLTVALWMSRLLVSSVGGTLAADLRAGLIQALALKPDVTDDQIVRVAKAFRLELDTEAGMSQQLRDQIAAVNGQSTSARD